MNTSAHIETLTTSHFPSEMGMVVIVLLILQTLLIIGLQRSRMSNKRARNALKETQKALEQRIHERTESLHTTNCLLKDEVARHEQTGRQLRDTKLYLQSMINSMPSIIIGVTAAGEVTHWNAAAENSFEIFSQDALGKKITTLLPHFPINPQTISNTIREGEPFATQYTEANRDSSKRYFEITLYPLMSHNEQGAVIRIDDVTFKVTIENLMIQNEKLYSLGEVAAGIAHEINNPLSVILQNTQNIQRRTNPELAMNQQRAAQIGIQLQHVDLYWRASEIPQMLEAIRDAGERSATIVRNMLEFSHNSKRNMAMVDVKYLMEQTLVLHRSHLQVEQQDNSTSIQLNTQYQEPLPAIKASAAELQQVFLNLLRNATQALKQHPVAAPQIDIRVYADSAQLVIEIQDNGPGMTDTVRAHIFEPFFTTKDVGAGTGLGLSVSYFIITERHSGSIEVDTAEGKGSRFIIKLPLAS